MIGFELIIFRNEFLFQVLIMEFLKESRGKAIGNQHRFREKQFL